MVIVVDIVIDIIMVQQIEIIIMIDQHVETIGKIIFIYIQINLKNILFFSVDVHRMIMIIMVIMHREIHQMVIIITVRHVLHLILDLFHHEMVQQHIIVIIIMMIIHLHHMFRLLHYLIEQVVVIVVNQIIMIIIHHHLDLIDHQIIVKYIHHY